MLFFCYSILQKQHKNKDKFKNKEEERKLVLRADETEKNEGISEVNVYVSIIEDALGFDNIEALQIHENTQL